MSEKQNIPVFFAVDDAFVKFAIVTITSMKENASKDCHLDVHILYTKMKQDMVDKTMALADENCSIEFNDVSSYMKTIEYKLPIRDYYSKTTYFRFFIAEMFPNYDRAIYLDSDMVVLGDISQLYNKPIGDNYVGVCNEQAMLNVGIYGDYVEKCVGVARDRYFNAGMLLINCVQFRNQKVLDQFIKLLHIYNFVCTQDEDYLNVICAGHTYWVGNEWDCELIFNPAINPEDYKIIHYLMWGKPWHYDDVPAADIFWNYAKKTSVYEDIKAVLASWGETEKARDAAQGAKLNETAIFETNRPDNFVNRMKTLKEGKFSSFPAATENAKVGRLVIVEKIKQMEKDAKFDVDAEDDPPARALRPKEVDYLQKKVSSKIKAFFAFKAARKAIKALEDAQILNWKIEGAENLKKINSGCVLTSNHFNALDSFLVQFVFDKFHERKPHSKFFRTIREGNYTSTAANIPKLYDTLMKCCNTLPIGSDRKVVNEFLNATDILLRQGHMILFYPEQAMWWNYRKPRPVKKGGFTIAAKANVPVLPVFITFKDRENVDGDGFKAQDYTIHICNPIYPDVHLSKMENAQIMMEKNFEAWKEVYEREYCIPLSYNS